MDAGYQEGPSALFNELGMPFPSPLSLLPLSRDHCIKFIIAGVAYDHTQGSVVVTDYVNSVLRIVSSDGIDPSPPPHPINPSVSAHFFLMNTHRN